ncbi:MAG: TolB family protein [Armatimonadota bacterium]
MSRGRLAGAALALLVGAAPVAALFDPPLLSRLIAMEDAEVAPVLAARLAWAGEALVIAGWERWPDAPAIIIYGAGLDVPAFPEPAHPPLFTVEPGTGAIVSWRRSDEGTVLLAALRPADGRLTLLDPDLTCLGPGPLVALPDGSVVAACKVGPTGTELRRFAVGTPSVLLARLPHPGCDELRLEADGEHLLALCAGDPPRAWRVSIRPGVWAEVEVEPPPPSSVLVTGVEFDAAAGNIVRPVGEERVVLAQQVAAACASPDGRALLVAGPDGLRVLDPSGQVVRRLWRAYPGEGRPSLLSWAPSGTRIAHCYRSEEGGSVRVAVLGTEDVEVRLRFPHGTPLAPGGRIWVAERFRVDAAGFVVEPVWSTLKALLRVREVVSAAEGLICTAVSEGVEGGVVERLTGSNEAPPGVEAQRSIAIGVGDGPSDAWMYSFSAEPRANLSGWLEGERVTGALLSVTVTRRRLPPQAG